MSTVTSYTLLSGPTAATPVNTSGSRLQSGKAAAVALLSFRRRSRSLSVCFASSAKGEHSPKTDLPPFNISPVALVHPVPPQEEERWQLEEDANAVKLWFEVPGFSKEDLVVEIDEDVLVIRKKPKADVNIHVEDQRAGAGPRPGRDTTATVGGRPSRVTPASAAAMGKADAAYDSGVYARLLLPAGYNRESVKAELASGELTVTIFKVKEHARRRINVDIRVPSSS